MERPTILPERRRETTPSSNSQPNFTSEALISIKSYEWHSNPSPESKVQCRDKTNMTELGKRGAIDRWPLL